MTTREDLATQFHAIKHDKTRGVLNAFLSEPPTLDLAAWLEELTRSKRHEWSTITREHEAGCEVIVVRPEWLNDVSVMLETRREQYGH